MGEYEPKYWNHIGKYQKEYDILQEKLVPSSGMAVSIDGEAIRCLGRFYHERYNNGHCNDKSYEIAFLTKWTYDKNINLGFKISEKMSDENLDVLCDLIIHTIAIAKIKPAKKTRFG